MDDIKRKKAVLDNDEVILTEIQHSEDSDFGEGVRDSDKDEKISEKIKISFGKFVQLVATHDFERILDKNPDEEVVISANLLTDLANSHSGDEAQNDKKIPIIFVVGLAAGVVLTYLLIKF